MSELTKRISLKISSVLSKVEPEPDLYTGSEQKVPAPAPQHYSSISICLIPLCLNIKYWQRNTHFNVIYYKVCSGREEGRENCVVLIQLLNLCRRYMYTRTSLGKRCMPHDRTPGCSSRPQTGAGRSSLTGKTTCRRRWWWSINKSWIRILVPTKNYDVQYDEKTETCPRVMK